MRKTAFYILCIYLFTGCGLLKKDEEETPLIEEQGKPLARVFNKYLYYEDIEGIEGENISKEDSAEIVNRYINAWVLRQLMVLRAESKIDEGDDEIRKRIEDCRNTLLIHEFEKQYLKEKLDTIVSEKELKAFYDSNIESFELKQNIFKGLYIKLPKDAPKQDKVKALMSAGNNNPELKSYCVRFASHCILEDTIWINFDDLVKKTPFMGINDKSEFLEKNRFAEQKDDNYIYFLKIKDYKISKQISPFEFVREQIRNTILNQRRIKLINDLKATIYKEANNSNEFEIFKNK